MMAFTIDSEKFPGINLKEGLLLPYQWEEQKWQHMVTIWTSSSSNEEVDLKTLINAYGVFSSRRKMIEATLRRLFTTTSSFEKWLKKQAIFRFAGYESLNQQNGRWYGFGLHPESVNGNQFTTYLKQERAGGGTILAVVARKSNGRYLIGLLEQSRPLQNQENPVLQVPGGYPIQIEGNAAVIHAATGVSEAESEMLGGKLIIKPEMLIPLFAPFNDNNGASLTGKHQGISTQLLEVPMEALVKTESGYTLSHEYATVSNPRLEGIFKVKFFDLEKALLTLINQPNDGYAGDAKAIIMLYRAYHYLYK